jgi:hypothetical protein
MFKNDVFILSIWSLDNLKEKCLLIKFHYYLFLNNKVLYLNARNSLLIYGSMASL